MEETADETWTSWRREDDTDNYRNLIEETDRLGWDCLLEGRVSTKWIEYARGRLEKTKNPMSPERWTKGLMDRLLKITHQQWIYRNHKVHLLGIGGLTLKQHDEIFDRLDELMHTDPDELLPEHQYLLTVDKDEVCGGTLSEQRTWIVRMKAAKKAKMRTTGDEYEEGGFRSHEVEMEQAR